MLYPHNYRLYMNINLTINIKLIRLTKAIKEITINPKCYSLQMVGDLSN